jgi:hypothetical protein
VQLGLPVSLRKTVVTRIRGLSILGEAYRVLATDFLNRTACAKGSASTIVEDGMRRRGRSGLSAGLKWEYEGSTAGSSSG